MAFVQSAQNTIGLSPRSLAFSSDVTPGNAILVCITMDGDVGPTITTNQGDTPFVRVDTTRLRTTGNLLGRVYLCESAVGGATTVTVASSGIFFGLIVLEYSGFAASPVDQVGTTEQQTSATPSSPTTAATTQADETLFGFCILDATRDWTAGAGYTLRSPSPTGVDAQAEDRVVSATGAYAADFVLSSSTGTSTFIATFKMAGGGSSGKPALYYQRMAT